MCRSRILFFGCLLALCASLLSAADDEARWQGTWRLVACTYDGAPQSGDVRWVVSGNRYTVHFDQVTETWTFKLDSGNKQIEADFPHGRKLTGLYEVTDDTLRVCYDLTGRRYPRSFGAGKGSRQILYEFRREAR